MVLTRRLFLYGYTLILESHIPLQTSFLGQQHYDTTNIVDAYGPNPLSCLLRQMHVRDRRIRSAQVFKDSSYELITRSHSSHDRLNSSGAAARCS